MRKQAEKFKFLKITMLVNSWQFGFRAQAFIKLVWGNKIFCYSVNIKREYNESCGERKIRMNEMNLQFHIPKQLKQITFLKKIKNWIKEVKVKLFRM